MPKELRFMGLFLSDCPEGLTSPEFLLGPEVTSLLIRPLPWNVASAAPQAVGPVVKAPPTYPSQATSGSVAGGGGKPPDWTVRSRGTAPNPWASAVVLVSLM